MWQYSEATLNELRGLQQATVDGGEKEVREEDSEVHSRAAEVMAELRTARIHDGPLTCSISDGAGVEVAVHVVLAVRVEDRVKFAGCGHQVCLFVHIEQLPRALKWPAEESRLGAGPVRVTHLLLGRSGQPVGWRGRVEPREKARNTVRRARRTAARVQRSAQGWHRHLKNRRTGATARRVRTFLVISGGRLISSRTATFIPHKLTTWSCPLLNGHGIKLNSAPATAWPGLVASPVIRSSPFGKMPICTARALAPRSATTLVI